MCACVCYVYVCYVCVCVRVRFHSSACCEAKQDISIGKQPLNKLLLDHLDFAFLPTTPRHQAGSDKACQSRWGPLGVKAGNQSWSKEFLSVSINQLTSSNNSSHRIYLSWSVTSKRWCTTCHCRSAARSSLAETRPSRLGAFLFPHRFSQIFKGSRGSGLLTDNNPNRPWCPGRKNGIPWYTRIAVYRVVTEKRTRHASETHRPGSWLSTFLPPSLSRLRR